MPTIISGDTGVNQVQDGVVGTSKLAAGAVTLMTTKRFKSAQQVITSGSTLTLAHGLGYEPMHVQLKLVCQTAEHNYSVGDIIIANASISNSVSDSKNCFIRVDGTNIYVMIGSTATATFTALNKTTWVGVDLANANWKLIVEAC